MKKYILALVALFCISAISVANTVSETRYKVTISTILKYTYEDENGNYVGESSASGGSQPIYVTANSPYEAEQQALIECSTMCQRSARKYEGTKQYNGKMCKCYSTREPYSVESVVAN